MMSNRRLVAVLCALALLALDPADPAATRLLRGLEPDR